MRVNGPRAGEAGVVSRRGTSAREELVRKSTSPGHGRSVFSEKLHGHRAGPGFTVRDTIFAPDLYICSLIGGKIKPAVPPSTLSRGAVLLTNAGQARANEQRPTAPHLSRMHALPVALTFLSRSVLSFWTRIFIFLRVRSSRGSNVTQHSVESMLELSLSLLCLNK